MKHAFVVGPPDAGRRVDRFVQAALGHVPTTLVRRLIRQKKVRVNGARTAADHRLEAGDEVVIHHTPRSADGPNARRASSARRYAGPDPSVLLQRDDLLFLDKPSGVACSDDGSDEACLPLWLAEHFAQGIAAGKVRPEPCHRLDRGTTGVVVVSLTAAAHDRFRRASERGRIVKEYEVAVWGDPPAVIACGVDLWRRPRALPGEPRVIAAGEKTPAAERWTALTDFERRVRGRHCALLRALLRTGRTHQIRAHCRILGYPVIGDPRYGSPDRDEEHGLEGEGRPLLHAARLVLDDDGGPIEVRAPWPAPDRARLEVLGLWRLRADPDRA